MDKKLFAELLESMTQMGEIARAERVVRFVAYGSPAPQGSKRFVGLSKRGRGILIESSKGAKPWRQDVHAAAFAARAGATPLDGPLSLRMVFTMPRPTSVSRRRRIYPMRRPDLSKLARSTEDAMVTAGLIADDARIVEYSRLAKVFPWEDPEALEAPGVRIEITVMCEEARPGRARPGLARPGVARHGKGLFEPI